MAPLRKLGLYLSSWKSKVGGRKAASSGGTHDGGGARRPATGFVDKLPPEKQRLAREYKGSVFSGSSDLPRIKR
jgi:hypothetical protein